MRNYVLILLCVISFCRGQYISGGNPTTISTYPFAASLLTNSGSGTSFQYACGGSILTATAVLSAATCFYTDDDIDEPGWWQVRAGSSNANSGGTVVQVVQITPHPDFNLLTLDYDLAVLRTEPITLQPGVAEAARIAGGAFQFAKNQRVLAVGWGSSLASALVLIVITNLTTYLLIFKDNLPGELTHVQTFAIDQDVCAVRYNDFGFEITDNMVCVGWLDVGVHGQCPEGGAGSALVVDGVVVGVYSWSQGCATLRYPNINTRLAPHWRWILAVGIAAID
ncbi:trypsin CFT-1 [Amyelois transitella]|uniref:trypsin CFT-1 n=1 Tax=Amyelois transitella TaxID=680683 RepID=UPI00298FD8A1|nr:trypsin CFT-1 [Amyelois transitella]